MDPAVNLEGGQVLDRQPAGIALRQMLAEWRILERKLRGMVANSLDRPRVQAEVVALRAAHHRLFIEIRRRD